MTRERPRTPDPNSDHRSRKGLVHIMAETSAPPQATLDSRLSTLPVGTVLTFHREGRRESITWTHNNWAGRSLVRSYLRCGWTLTAGRAA